MKLQSRILTLGMASLIAAGLLAAPTMASAQRYRRSSTHSEDSARTNAIVLGAAGLLLMNHHQSTLGTIALGAAGYEAIQMQNSINDRHDRQQRYGYNSRGQRYGSSYSSQDNCNYRNRNESMYSDGGYYDQLGAYHKSGYDAGYYSRSGQYDQRVINGRYDNRRNDDCDNNDRNRGRDWASTRGNKRGWDKNGKRG